MRSEKQLEAARKGFANATQKRVNKKEKRIEEFKGIMHLPYTNQQFAARLGVSDETIRRYKKAIEKEQADERRRKYGSESDISDI